MNADTTADHALPAATTTGGDTGASEPGLDTSAPARPPARTSREGMARKSALDMVRSLAVIGVVVAVVMLLVPQPKSTYTPDVDLAAVGAAARTAGDVPVVAPATPIGWKVTSARRERAVAPLPASWHVGYLTGSGGYAGLETTAAASESWIADVTIDGVDTQTTQDVAGRPWQVWQSQGEDRTSLLQGSVGGQMIVVTGTATLDELVELARLAQQQG